jgi:hypothetical protein
MKQFARKSGTFSIVRSSNEAVPASRSEERAVALRGSFDGWLNSVAPTFVQSESSQDEPKTAYRSRRILTATDILRVNRATIRESTAPRLWPPDVVLKFLAADVIKRNK